MSIANDTTGKAHYADQEAHEILAEPGHAAAAMGFALALAGQALASALPGAGLLWVREVAAIAETGNPYGYGLASFGISPNCLIVAQMRTHTDALRAALEGARCAALGAVVLETAGTVDLTASRRLKLAAEKSGVSIILVRPNSFCASNAVPIRWRVAAVPRTHPHAAMEAVFRAEILKHPKGMAGRCCVVEWDHERRCFTEALSLPVAAVPGVGSLAA